MSDLTATNCGCNNSCGNNNCGNGIFGNSCIWIILLLFCGGGCGNNNGCGLLGNNNGCGGNDCCEWLIWILLLSGISRSFVGTITPGYGLFCTPKD